MIFSLVVVFFIGYLLIVFEQKIRQDKSSIALLTGTLLWIVLALHSDDMERLNQELAHHLNDISGIIFFLMGAMTIVELIDINHGFDYILEKIQMNDKRKIALSLTLLSFLLSAIIDNLTTAIVMASLSRKLFDQAEDRRYMAALIIVASNSGGAFSPIGDVTTTMLWISGRISAFKVIYSLFIPCMVSVAVPFIILSKHFNGTVELLQKNEGQNNLFERNFILFFGLILMLLVPILKLFTGLPPFVGMMFCVGLFWIVTEILHKKNDREQRNQNSIYAALERIDLPSLLFFLGILLSVAALQSAQVLTLIATWSADHIPNEHVLAISIGLISSIFDNVPILASIQGMYSTEVYPLDHSFWIFLTYCVGVGGSLLVVGSAAGVAIMGCEDLKFGWYLKKVSFPILVGFLLGALVFFVI